MYIDEIASHLLKRVDIHYEKGAVNPGGPHYRARHRLSPISIGHDECLFLNKIVDAIKPQYTFVIGNAFGFSSVFLAMATGTQVVSIDNRTEGNGEECAAIAEWLAKQMGCTNLQQLRAESPQDVPHVLGQNKIDLCLIDGAHAPPHPKNDTLAVIPHLSDKGVIVWHDGFAVGVKEAVVAARELGYDCREYPTSCVMNMGAKDASIHLSLS